MKVPKPLYEFLDFIDINKVDWEFLSENPNAIHVLEKNLDKIVWRYLSENPNAIPLLEKYPDNICWYWISQNQSIFEIDYKTMKKTNG